MSDAKRFDDLPPEVQDFLIQLRGDEVRTLSEGIRLVGAIHTVAIFVKWLIVGILGLAIGVVMFGESVGKIMAWMARG